MSFLYFNYSTWVEDLYKLLEAVSEPYKPDPKEQRRIKQAMHVLRKCYGGGKISTVNYLKKKYPKTDNWCEVKRLREMGVW